MFGIHAGEVCDSSNYEQLGTVLRYVKNDKPIEKLIEFLLISNSYTMRDWMSSGCTMNKPRTIALTLSEINTN